MIYKDFANKLINNFKILGAAKVAGGILSALTLLIIGRTLGVEKFGLFSMVISIVEICNILLSFRIWDTSVKFVGSNIDNKEKISKYLALSFTLSMASSLISFLFIIFIGGNFADGILKTDFSSKQLIASYAIIVLFISTNEIIDGILRVFDKYSYIFKINTYTNLFRFTLILALILKFNPSIQNIIYCFIGSYILSFILRIIFLSTTLNENRIEINFLKLPSYKSSIGFIKFMLNTHFSNILNVANDKNLGVLAVGFIGSPYYAGLYRAARAIVKIIRRIMDPVLEIIFPELVKLYSEQNFELYKRIIFDSTKILLIASVTLGVIIITFSNQIITLFFGPQFIKSVLSMKILVIAMIFHNLAYWVNPAMLSSGNPKFLTIITVITTFIYCLSLPYLINLMDHEGAAISLLIKNISTLTLGIVFYYKFLQNKN